MTQFETLPLSAAQADDEPVDPGFLVPDYNTVWPAVGAELGAGVAGVGGV